MDVKTIEKEIAQLPTSERSIMVTEVMFDQCQEILGDEACSDRLRELFGVDCLEKLDKRLKTGI